MTLTSLKKLTLLLVFAFCLSLFACGGQAGELADDVSSGSLSGPFGLVEAEAAATQQTKNLVKLCKVWGYVKYRHPAFLLGRLDWDEELLQLIPQVEAAQTGEEVNALLHTWFGTLDAYTYGVREVQDVSVTDDMIVEANTAWTEDAAYLGEELAADLARLAEMPISKDRTHAPVFFIESGAPDFSHESDVPAAYEDVRFRLLGVFRLWNAIEYYYPYLHLLDRDWEACLLDAIPPLVDASDQAGYEHVIYSLTSQLHDPHVVVSDTATNLYAFAKYLNVQYVFPADLTVAEGKLVVTEVAEGCPLTAGDALVRLNGRDIAAIAADLRPYYSLSREEILLPLLRYTIATSQTEEIAVTVLRGGQEMDFSVQGIQYQLPTKEDTLPPYELLDGNIGLINPARIDGNDTLFEAMAAVKDTEALILDLRQYPGSWSFNNIHNYLLPSIRQTIKMAMPFAALPGTYTVRPTYFGYDPGYPPDFYSYDRPVAILINASSSSFSENTTMILRVSENVTVIGENSMGTDGNVTYLPLPGSLSVRFSSVGVYQLDGTQTQRTGITPDIYVAPTIQGIAGGRDEQMEVAINYLQSTQ